MSKEDVNDAKLDAIQERLDELKTLPVSVEGLRVEVESLKVAVAKIAQPGQTPWCIQHSKSLEAFDVRLSSVEKRVWYASGAAAVIAFIANHLIKK